MTPVTSVTSQLPVGIQVSTPIPGLGEAQGGWSRTGRARKAHRSSRATWLHPTTPGNGMQPQVWQCRQGSLVVHGTQLPEHSHFSLPFLGSLLWPRGCRTGGSSCTDPKTRSVPCSKPCSDLRPGFSKGIQVLLHRELPRPGELDTVPEGEQSRVASNKQVKDTNQSQLGANPSWAKPGGNPGTHGIVTSSPGGA